MKTVHYWMGRVIGDDDVSHYQANDEIDEVAWVPFDDAMSLLTYPYDRETLRESMLVRKKTRAFVILRHGQARSRKSWRKNDRLRPLVRTGTLQAQRTVPVLAAYDVSMVATSSSIRCVQSVAPYVDVTGVKPREFDGLSEEDATDESVREIVQELLDHKGGVVLCTHRPVLPAVFDALGVTEAKLEPGSMFVVHQRSGKVVATERHTGVTRLRSCDVCHISAQPSPNGLPAVHSSFTDADATGHLACLTSWCQLPLRSQEITK